jgi:hypothetical protein
MSLRTAAYGSGCQTSSRGPKRQLNRHSVDRRDLLEFAEHVYEQVAAFVDALRDVLEEDYAAMLVERPGLALPPSGEWSPERSE